MSALAGLDVAGDPSSGKGWTASTVSQWRDGDHMDWDGPAVWLMFGFMAFFWLGLLAVAAVALARWARPQNRSGESALEVAQHRLARGEISAEEYERIRDTLRK